MATQEELRQRALLARAAAAKEAEDNKSFVGKAYDYMTGKGRTEGFPELQDAPNLPESLTGPQGPRTVRESIEEWKQGETIVPRDMMAPLAADLSLHVDPNAVADMIEGKLKAADPNMKRGQDKHGNPTITFKGKTYYVNAPGASEADAYQLFGQLIAFSPASISGAAAKTIFSRMLKTGILSAGTSVGLDVLAGEQGSEQGTDWWRAGMTGVLGGVFEGLAPALKHGWRTIFSKPQYFDEATGKLTQEGARIAREAGLDPVDMDRRLAQAFSRQVTDEPIPALAKTRAYEEAYGFPYTRGQQLAQAGDFDQIAREEGMIHGTRGPTAKSEMLATKEMMETQTQEALETATGRVARPVQETGEEVMTGVQRAEQAKSAEVSRLYDVAAPTAARARVTRANFSGLMKDVRQGVRELGLDLESHPKTINTIRRLGGMFKKAKKGDKLDITEVSLQKIERERRIIIQKLKSAKGEDKNALLEVKAAMDGWLDKAFDDALFSGDEVALKALKAARKEAHEYFSLFTKQRGKTPDEVGAAMEKILYADATPEMAMNYILGAGQLGKKQLSANIVKRLKKVLDPDDFESLKDAAWTRLTRGAEGQMKSPKMYVKHFDELYTGNKSLLDELYTPDEIRTMKAARDAIALMKIPEHATNPSRTGWTLLSTVRRLFHWRGTAQAVLHKKPLYGGLLHTIGRAIPGAGPVLQSTAARRAATQIPKPPPASPPTVAAAIAGTRLAGEE